jgi:NADH:ubiquinone oxidoreductase subunit 2 (subunit N)
VIASTISLYYYLMVIRQMYVLQTDGHLVDPQAPDQRIERWRLTTSGYAVTAVLFAGIFVVGLYVSPLATAADRAAAALFG